MKLKIIADGKNPAQTKIVDVESGEMLEDVLGVEISIHAMGIEAAIVMSAVDLEIEILEAREVDPSDTEGDGRDGGDSDN